MTDGVAAVMAEFTALRTEIGNRSTAQYTLAGIALVAVSTLGGLAIGPKTVDQPLLLLVTPVCVATGLLWLDHAHAIFQIGTYIRERLWPYLDTNATKDGSVFVEGYETFAIKHRPMIIERQVLLIPFAIVFILPCLAPFFLLGRSRADWVYAGVAVDGIFAMALAVAWSRFLIGAVAAAPSP